jgi:hypothetical protein
MIGMTNSTRDQIAKQKQNTILILNTIPMHSIKTIEESQPKSSCIRKGTVNKKSALQRY